MIFCIATDHPYEKNFRTIYTNDCLINTRMIPFNKKCQGERNFRDCSFSRGNMHFSPY
jgi:hypothetical protein